jgi:hypothetical protein
MNLAQDHPMYVKDRPTIDSIVYKELKDLGKQEIVDLARLLIRYASSSGQQDIRGQIIQALDRWGKTPEQLQIKAREIWQSGWRPGQLDGDEVGSGADVEAGAV